ncbi:hypothetical protein A9995_14570 [Erythrobacter sp. QSSC1-22B]|nr:hypothetical protein A9995_14570 [Erythrobacter sp. QSSC1-22B]
MGLTLSACGSATNPEPDDNQMTAEPAGDDTMATLPVPHRVAFMAGHVTAGLALYRAGAASEASPHLLHPVSETHAAERVGIDALGFDAAPFEAVSAALEENRPAAEVEPMLQAAEANLTLVRRNAGGDPKNIIDYLMDTTDEEYAIGVRDGVVTDAGEYQDAYGFAVVALETAQSLPDATRSGTEGELRALVDLWPAGGPLAASKPPSNSAVTAQTARVRAALAESN